MERETKGGMRVVHSPPPGLGTQNRRPEPLFFGFPAKIAPLLIFPPKSSLNVRSTILPPPLLCALLCGGGIFPAPALHVEEDPALLTSPLVASQSVSQSVPRAVEQNKAAPHSVTYLCDMMDNIFHKPLENTVAETAVLSTETMPWDSIGVSSKTIIMSTAQCSEEHVLKYTFKACDPEQTGEVSVFRIIEYLQEMTGQSCEDWRFQSLYKKFDPEERGITVDFPTFRAVMKEWITDCRQDGEEAVDLMNSIQDLQHGNKQLAVKNIKLQRTIEAAEELNSKLSEEITELKERLRGNQQVLEQARVMRNELEELKVFSKSLEEENSKLHTEIRQLEKQQQIINVQVDSLHEENKKLLLEKESSKRKIKELFTEKAKMQFQICEYESLISCKDTEINEKLKQTEGLTLALDEYQMMVQELKLEVSRLQDQLCQSYKDLEMLPIDNTDTCLHSPAQPLCMEIEEKQKGEEVGLPSPLCGMLPSLRTPPADPGELRNLEEGLELGRSGADSTKALLQRTCSLSHLHLVLNSKLTLKNQECHQQQHHLASEMMGRSTEALFQEHALLPVHGELIPVGGKRLFDNWFEILIERFLEINLSSLLLRILRKLVLSGLLIACILLLAIFYFVLPYSHHPVWFDPKGASCSYFQLRYLQAPPI